ncbi:hypothetical protein K4L44_09585 [Halosquirtibacter laminarini]|uniref:Uncharacterized protein n=1 Tax=Halosquirtibacter laminarini TaxID=3374600 RepID=A0AC61NBI8_9BACT|nr:hypothetical protein K4L44_09585 [Prolixibacteraceae bacterium]
MRITTGHYSTYRTTISGEEYFVNISASYPFTVYLGSYSFSLTISSIARQKPRNVQLKIGRREMHALVDKRSMSKESTRQMDMYALNKVKKDIAAGKIILR